MKWYNMFINETEMEKLSDVLSKEPFSFESENKLITAYIHLEGKIQPFMLYDGTMVVFYHHTFDHLPKDVRKQIQKELKTVKALEKIVQG